MSLANHLLILGCFNSGTNFAHHFLGLNGFQLANMSLQQLYYKHYTAPILDLILQRQTAPLNLAFVVVVRDPFEWLLAMVKSPYELAMTAWNRPCAIGLHAHNHDLTYQEHFDQMQLPPITCAEALSFASLPALWNHSYRGWLDLLQQRQVPHMLLRYEDLLLQPAEALTALAERFHLPTPEHLRIPLPPAKGHGLPNGYVSARARLWQRTVAPEFEVTRRRFFKHIDPDLLRDFNYDLTPRKSLIAEKPAASPA